jgi:sugar lactone lactonase YvrE
MNLSHLRIPAINALLIFIIATGFSACKKHDPKPGGNDPSNPNSSLTVTSLSVNSGPYNTVVTISGTGFDAVAANDKVYFNGMAATISSATKNTIVAVVPVGAGTGKVSVSVSSVNNGISVNGPVFTYTYTLTVSTIAGDGRQGFFEGKGTNAEFDRPWGICTDADGNVYVADYGNYVIRKIDAAGNVTVFAGKPLAYGWQDGQGTAQETAATFEGPSFIKTDSHGNFFVTDGSTLVRKITPQGVVTTFAGNKNGFNFFPSLSSPHGIAIDSVGSVYVAEENLRKITTAGVATRYAGRYYIGNEEGYGPDAAFGAAEGLVFDARGNLYMADSYYSVIRKISPADTMTTVAGTGSFGSNNGLGKAASFRGPSGLAIDKAGNIYIADAGNNQIRKMAPDGTVTTFAGSGAQGRADGPASTATFFAPKDVAVDAKGNVYVTDQLNNLIRKISME